MWTAACNQYGYGVFLERKGKNWLAHRFAYESMTGKIPDALQLDHRCHNHACVNPAHLRIATNKQNNEHRRGANSNNHSSGARGVTWDARRRKWMAKVEHDGRHYYAGRFGTVAEAERAAAALRAGLFTHAD
jgi:hypothetical protein